MDDGSVKMVDKDVIQMRNNVMDAGLEVMVVMVMVIALKVIWEAMVVF